MIKSIFIIIFSIKELIKLRGHLRSEDVIYNIVTTVDNAVLYNWNLLRVELKCPQQQKINRWGDNVLTWWDGKNPFTMYMYIKSHCTL